MRDYNIVYNIYMIRNLATLRKNIYIILNYANKTIALYYTYETYRDIFYTSKYFYLILLYTNILFKYINKIYRNAFLKYR